MTDNRQGASWSGSDAGYLPAIAVGMAIVLCLALAALHDIARREAKLTLEYTVYAVCVAAIGSLCSAALKHLAGKQKPLWMGATGGLFLLLNTAAIRTMLEPKFAGDTIASALFLAMGVPVLGMTGYQLLRRN